MHFLFLASVSYGNDSIAMIQWCYEQGLAADTALIYADTGWAHDDWATRVARAEAWARTLGFTPFRSKGEGLEALVRRKKGWPRQGLQFCTQHLKVEPLNVVQDALDPDRFSVVLVGKRRAESANRRDTPEAIWRSPYNGNRALMHPLVALSDEERNALLQRAGWEPLPHRSDECFPCINSNKSDLLRLGVEDPARVARIRLLEQDLGITSKGKPRTMFRPYRYRGATGIDAMIRWASTERGADFDDGTGDDCAEYAVGCGV